MAIEMTLTKSRPWVSNATLGREAMSGRVLVDPENNIFGTNPHLKFKELYKNSEKQVLVYALEF
jgi:ribosomal protein S6--L-glutamate ligase